MVIEKCAVCGEDLFREVTIFDKTQLLRRACACRRAELEKEEKETEAWKRHNRSRDIIDKGYLNKGYAQYTFASADEKDSKIVKDLKQYCDNWDKAKAVNRGVYFFGNYGTGKTFYASCIANEIRNKGEYVLIGSAAELVRYFTRDYGRNEDAEDQVRRYPLMVIDDIGVERGNENTLSVMNEIIDMRYMAKKPLIVTSNFGLEELYKGSGIYGERIASRLEAMCVPYKVAGKDRRKNG